MRPELFSRFRSPDHPPRTGRHGRSTGLLLRTWFLPAALTAAAVAAVAAGCDEDTAGPAHQHQASLLTMSQSSVQLQPGQQVQLAVTAVCSCGDQVEVGVTWESDNMSVATVSLTGNVTAVGPGSATITANAAGLWAVATVSVPMPEEPGYSLRAVTPGVELLQLGEGHIPIWIARTGGFDGTVTLTAEAIPAGLAVTFSEEVVSDNMAEIFFTAGTPLPAGTHLLTVVGSAEGLLPQTVQVAVNVVTPEAGDFLLKPDPEWFTVGRGSTGTTKILVTRTEAFSWGWVGLGVSDAPAGFSWEFAPPDGFDFTVSTLTIEVAPEVPAGTYELAVNGIFEVWGGERWTHVHVTVVDLPELPETPKR